MAGVSKVNATLPLGVPLAGFNYGPRRVTLWPIPEPSTYTTWMNGNVGHLDPNWAKAAVIDNGLERFAFVTMDAVGADGIIGDLSYLMAVEMGFTVKRENVIFSASHTHSGPGAISSEFLWAVAPATDLLVPEIQKMYCNSLALAMVKAEQSMQPAKMDIGVGTLTGVTSNRRAPNPWVRSDTIDSHLGVIRIDSIKGEPIATIWNYAIHGTCYFPDNMKFSSDIMGASSDSIEKLVGGIALFVNSDAGDIEPTSDTCGCRNGICNFAGAQKIASAVQKIRASLNPTSNVYIETFSQIIPFGETNLNLTLARADNCGPIDICSICFILKCDANIHLPESWVEENPRFTAVKFIINGITTALVTIPGEALIELGWKIRNDTQKLGFDQTLLFGYTNNYLGYFATANEYIYGGYESLLSFWGIDTAEIVRSGVMAVVSQVKPYR